MGQWRTVIRRYVRATTSDILTALQWIVSANHDDFYHQNLLIFVNRQILFARRYASAGSSRHRVRPSVCHKGLGSTVPKLLGSRKQRHVIPTDALHDEAKVLSEAFWVSAWGQHCRVVTHFYMNWHHNCWNLSNRQFWLFTPMSNASEQLSFQCR